MGWVIFQQARSEPVPTTAPSPAGRPKITWSQAQVDLALPRGGGTNIQITFTSTDGLQNIAIVPVPALSALLSIKPSILSVVPPNQPQTVNLSFSIPAAQGAGPHEGTVHVTSGNRTLPATLKINVVVVPATPVGVLENLTYNLRAANLELALFAFVEKTKGITNREFLTGLPPAGWQSLANLFARARLTGEFPRLRVYRGPLVEPNGSMSDVEFMMSVDDFGVWRISNW